jgi:hypothetical protein
VSGELAATIFTVVHEEKLHRKNCVLRRGKALWSAVEWGVVVGGTCRKMEGGGIGFLGAWEMKEYKRKLG